MSDKHDEPQRPVLRIVRGEPDDAELAALTVALAASAAAQTAAPAAGEPPLSVWADRADALRHPATGRPLRPGPGAWRASSWPR